MCVGLCDVCVCVCVCACACPLRLRALGNYLTSFRIWTGHISSIKQVSHSLVKCDQSVSQPLYVYFRIFV